MATKDSERLKAALDLRAFLRAVKAGGELQEISGAHWNLELGALTELFAEQTPTPALLFDAIPGYPRGRRVLSNILFSPLRQSLALAMAPELRGVALVQTLKTKLAELKPIPPEQMKSAPALQNVVHGHSVDVLKFPAPHWHEKDGGRYIGTFDAVISRDPDSGYVNVGTYRVQVHDEKTVGLWIIPGKHGNLIAQKYWRQGEDCPFLVACGMPPSMILASAVGIPWGDERVRFSRWAAWRAGSDRQRHGDGIAYACECRTRTRRFRAAAGESLASGRPFWRVAGLLRFRRRRSAGGEGVDDLSSR